MSRITAKKAAEMWKLAEATYRSQQNGRRTAIARRFREFYERKAKGE